ncbi:hypothetical protein C7U60_12455 [Mesorhizobium plurifarium]|uniref:hypothetical protein n=1 Tax=Sinorhizobium arboris TaxID=76745 RepID=UPI00040E305B|nr:hypothetical protein [Sinorhizobium arboris]PST22048.1 hypothetical protein C7U60_12455 [Mesorhizobium plurifarium]
MQTRSVIEIVGSGGDLPADLIVAGYWASQTGLVVFILNDVAPQAIDLVLDPIVATLPLTIPGVLYVDIEDRLRVRETLLFAEEIYVATRVFRHLASRWGKAPAAIASVDTAIPRLDGRALVEGDAGTSNVAESYAAEAPVPIGNRPGWRATDATIRSLRRKAILMPSASSPAS